MSEKYYSLSPYLWCDGNPVKFKDNDGKKIVFADNSPISFILDYIIAYDYLHKAGASELLDKLVADDNIYTIKEYGENSYFNHTTNTIYWNSRRAILTNNVYTLTAAEILSHEIDHALVYNANPKAALKRVDDTNSKYENKEEERVIKGSEQKVAKKLGRLSDGESTRDDHGGISYDVDSPITEEITGVVVTNH